VARRPPAGRPDERTSVEPDDTLVTEAAPADERDDGRGPGRRADGEPQRPEKPEKTEKKNDDGGVAGFFRELPGLIIIAFGLALLIKTFLIQAFFIPSQSMVPTLKVGDRVLVNKLVYDFGDVQRGDVIVFENPHLQEPDRNVFEAAWNWLTEGLGFSADPEKDFIKRVVGLPGETIEIRNGRVLIDGRRIEEPYLTPQAQRDRSDLAPTVVDQGRVFVMGDNRPNSQDSRSSLGQIPLDKVVGKAFVLLWPPSRIEWLSDG
jgi:signal peptidase I